VCVGGHYSTERGRKSGVALSTSSLDLNRSQLRVARLTDWAELEGRGALVLRETASIMDAEDLTHPFDTRGQGDLKTV
jgi:hypothetical protein